MRTDSQTSNVYYSKLRIIIQHKLVSTSRKTCSIRMRSHHLYPSVAKHLKAAWDGLKSTLYPTGAATHYHPCRGVIMHHPKTIDVSVRNRERKRPYVYITYAGT